MKFNKLTLTAIILLAGFALLHASVQPQIVKVSGNRFLFYTIDNQNHANIDLFKIENGSLKRLDSFSPKFPEKDLIVKGVAPDGSQYSGPKYQLLGSVDGRYYFCIPDMPKILEYDRAGHVITERFTPFPKIMKSVSKAGDSIIISSNMVLAPPRARPCENKHFVKKSKEWKDEGCFGVGRNLLLEMDFPDTAVSGDGKLTAIYFPKASELSLFDIATGKLKEKYKIARNHSFLKDKKYKLEFLFEIKGGYFLVKILDDAVVIFKLHKKEWRLAEKIPGRFQQVILLENHAVLLHEGKLDVKELDF